MSKSRQNSNIPNRQSVADRATLKTKTGTTDGEVLLQDDISLLYTWNSTRAVADDNEGTVIAPTGATVGCWEAKYSA